MWEQAPENTLESLRHAIGFHDGIEFDLRLTADGEVIIHHDADVSVPKSMLTSSKPWVEHYTLDELESFGFCSFMFVID
jgi:glycerophosphoryl diester phosphodiesterase